MSSRAPQKDQKTEEIIEKLTKDLEDYRDKLALKNEAINEIQTKLSTMTTKYDTVERAVSLNKKTIKKVSIA